MCSQPDKAAAPPAIPAELGWALSLVLLMAVLQALPDGWQTALRYERDAVLQGQVWRLLTGGFIHLGWAHLALNATAMLILAWVFTEDQGGLVSAAQLATCAIASHLGLLLFSPQIFWAVGLSGALHGLFAIGALTWIAQSQRAGWLLLGGEIVKVGWEQIAGELPLSREIVGGSILVDAHLWGMLGGIGIFLAQAFWRRRTSRL